MFYHTVIATVVWVSVGVLSLFIDSDVAVITLFNACVCYIVGATGTVVAVYFAGAIGFAECGVV